MKFIFYVFVFSVVSFFGARAATFDSGWVNAHEYVSITRKNYRKGMMPFSIKCKSAGKIGQTRKNTLLRVRFKPNPRKMKYYWAWGSRLKVIGRKLKKKGYTRVSYNFFKRPITGLVIPCAIWYKMR